MVGKRNGDASEHDASGSDPEEAAPDWASLWLFGPSAIVGGAIGMLLSSLFFDNLVTGVAFGMMFGIIGAVIMQYARGHRGNAG